MKDRDMIARSTVLVLAITGVALSGCAAGGPSTEQKHELGCASGTVTGAVLGGLAGSLIGGGVGQVIATGAGAAIGGMVGNRLTCA
jgi:outer membrane lipoprotein SlyB